MTEFGTINAINTSNERALSRLSRAIKLSAGQFALILARCNYLTLQEEIWQQYQSSSSEVVKEVYLPKSITTLFTTIHGELENESAEAVVVFALESVQALDQLLEATNQVREEFRKHLPFPLVLWVTDEVLQKLARFAPDFKTWASASIKFEFATVELVNLWEQGVQELFTRLLDAGAAQFIDNGALDLAPGCWRRRELEYARGDLRSRGVNLAPASEATWQFILGRDAYSNDQIDQALEQYQQSVDFWQQEDNGQQRQLTTDKIGILLFHIGLCYVRQASKQREYQSGAWEQAKDCFRSALDIFTAQGYKEWEAQLTIHLGFVLEQLQDWDELQSLALNFILASNSNNSTVELAQAYGFLTQAALAKVNWQEAKLLAQMALNMLEQSPSPREYQERALYLLLLARSEFQLHEHQQAIDHLEQARKVALGCSIWVTQHSHTGEHKPLRSHEAEQLYLDILEELRQIYFQQRQYQLAFEVKQEKLAVEQYCGLRAFLGASPLSSLRQQSGGSRSKKSPNIAPEGAIAASGRQQDVNQLLERLSRSEHKLTVIHGSSGVGKSSLLRAGLLPALQGQIIAAREVMPVLHRIRRDWQYDLRQSLLTALRELDNWGDKESEKWRTGTIIEQLHLLSQSNLLVVLIFDQFEEFFFVCIEEDERRQFYEFLRDCLNLPFIKVILSLREDYLHYLLQWEKFGTLEPINNNILDRQVRYPLGDLTCEEATRVIESLAVQSRFSPENALIEALVKDLAEKTGTVRPIELQVVGAQLQAEKITTLEQYQRLGDDPKATLVEQSLLTVIADCGKENEYLVWQVLFLLTNDKGTRPSRTQTELIVGLSRLGAQVVRQLSGDASKLVWAWQLVKRKQVPGRNYPLPRPQFPSPNSLDLILNILVGSGLVFRVREEPEDRYQLVHDYLVEPIRQKYHQRLQMDIENQLTRTKSELVRVRKQRLQALTIGTTMTILALAAGVFGWGASQQTKKAQELSFNSELIAMSTSAKALLASEKPFDALLEALRAAKKMEAESKKLPQRANSDSQFMLSASTSVNPDTQLQVVTTLEQAVYDIHERNSLEGHGDIVWDVSFSPNGQLLASASKDGTLKLWRPNGTLVNTLNGHENSVTSVAFSPDGQVLASSSWDGTVRLWKVDGTPVQKISAHSGFVYRVNFSPDGQYLVSCGGDGQIKIWAANGKLIRVLSGHQGKVNDAKFSRDGQFLASAGEDQTVRIWSSRTGKLLSVLQAHNDQVNYVAFSPQGDLLVTASEDYTVKLWRHLPTKQPIYELEQTLRGESPWRSVKFSHNGQLIAASSFDHGVKLWNLEGKTELILKGHSDGINGISFSPDALTLASASSDKNIKLWHLAGLSRTVLRGHTEHVRDVTFSYDGSLVASGSRDKTIKIWTRDGRLLHTLIGHGDTVESVSFSPDGNLIASASRDQTVKLWSLDGRLLKTLTGHGNWVTDVSWSHDGQSLASASRDHLIRIWSRNGELKEILRGHSDRVNSVTFSPDDQVLASSSDDLTIKLWSFAGEDLHSQLIATLSGHQSWVLDVSFTPDGKQIASTSYDNTVKFWNLEGQELKTLQGHTDSVARLSFSPMSPEGRFMATATWDSQLKLWRSDDTLLQSLKGHENRITSVSWSRDGKAIATASEDKSVIIWNLDVDDLINLSCTWLTDYLDNNAKVRENDSSLCN